MVWTHHGQHFRIRFSLPEKHIGILGEKIEPGWRWLFLECQAGACAPVRDHSHLLPPLYFRSIYCTVPCSFIKELRTQLTKLIRREPNTADQKPKTSKPGMTPEAILSMKALIKNVNRPRLNILIGRVKMMTIGLKNAFSMPNMAAAKKAEKKPLTRIPSSKYEAMIIAPVKISHLTKIPFTVFLHELDSPRSVTCGVVIQTRIFLIGYWNVLDKAEQGFGKQLVNI